MAGLFGGYNLPPWMYGLGGGLEENRSNAMLGGSPVQGVPSPLFDDRWGPVPQALASGEFDPQGNNFLGQEAYAPRPGGAPTAPPSFPPPTMSPGATQFAGGGGQALGYAPEQPKPQQPLANGVPPQQQQAQYTPPEPSIGERFSAAGRNLLMMTLPQLGLALKGFQTGRTTSDEEQAKQNAALQHVAGDNELDPNLKSALLGSRELAVDYVAQKVKKLGGSTQDIMEYEYARRQGFKGTLEDFMKTVKQREVENLGIQPQYYFDKNGNLQAFQLGNRGSVKAVVPPEGGQLATKNLLREETATHINWLDPFSRQIVRSEPKNKEEGARQAAKGGQVGKIEGAALGGLQEVQSTTARLMSRISEIENHKSLDTATGFILGRFPSLTPGAADVHERIKEVGSSVWTQSIAVMKNLGALSNAEGSRIEAARTRLSTAKSTDDFKTALRDIREVLQTGMENARKIAKGEMDPYKNAPEGAPTDVDALRKKYNLK